MKTALLLIDIQNDYFPSGKMELVGSLQAAAAAARLLATFRKQSLLVYHVQHISTRPTSTFFLPGTPGVEIFPGVAPLPNEPVVTKHFPNSFRETDLEDTLRRDKVERLLVCGMMTSMCVDATVRAAFDLGFSCTVAQDACATRDLSFEGVTIPARQVHGAFLSALETVYANIKPTDVILNNIASSDH